LMRSMDGEMPQSWGMGEGGGLPKRDATAELEVTDHRG
jgi:hypothetical protein